MSRVIGQLICGAALIALGATMGCNSNDQPEDMAVALDMNVLSNCGHPGDPGNSLGIGKFCRTGNDCTGQKASLCSALGNGSKPSPSDTYFCTIYPCHPDGGTNECGENASCQCGSGSGGGGCACAPDHC
jgi:hypothetical protein